MNKTKDNISLIKISRSKIKSKNDILKQLIININKSVVIKNRSVYAI